MIRFELPGQPYANKRARATRRGKHAAIHDHADNVSWRGVAQVHMIEAMAGRPPLEGPVRLVIRIRFAMPTSRHLKRGVRPREWHVKKPDASNVQKGIEDAGNGILWVDDRQICDLRVIKYTGAQGEPPGVLVVVEELRNG